MRTKQKLNQKLAAALYEDAKRFGRARGMSTREVLVGRLDETWDDINLDAETLRTLAIEGLTRRIVERVLARRSAAGPRAEVASHERAPYPRRACH